MSNSPSSKYFTELIKELRARSEGIEWTTRVVTIRNKRTRVLEAYNPETEQGIAISIPKNTYDKEKIIDTCLANAQSLMPTDLVKEVIKEQQSRE